MHDEMGELKAQLSALQEENAQLRNTLKSIFASNLIEAFAYQSESFDISRKDFTQLAGVHFQGDCFFVILFFERQKINRFLDIDTFPMQPNTPPQCSHEDIRDVINSSFSPRHIVYTIPSRGQILSIVNFQMLPDDTEASAEEELAFTMKTINFKLNAQYHFTFNIFVSSMQTGVQNVSRGTRDCEQVQDYSLLLDNTEPQILFYSEFKTISAPKPTVVNTATLEFSRDIRNKDYAAARKLLNEQLIPQLSDTNRTIMFLRLEFTRLTEVFIQVVLENGIFTPERRQQAVEQLLKAKKPAELSSVMNDALLELEQVSKKNLSHMQDTAEKLHDYVSRFYSDPNLDVSFVASLFGISSVYASQVHKKCYGETLFAWIQTCRLIAASELLRTGSSVKEAAAISGFGNAANLIRTYKKYYGLTPGQQFSL